MTEEKIRPINIIYHDENYDQFYQSILEDCLTIMKETKGTLILTKNKQQLELLLKYIKRTTPKSKYALITNGRCSETIISFIKKKGYRDLFVKACIYCNNISKYQNIQENHKDFIGDLAADPKSISSIIRSYFDIIADNEKVNCNTIINYCTYNYYYHLHKMIADKYQKLKSYEISKFKPKVYGNNKDDIIVKIYNFSDSLKNCNSCQEFIFNYLKDDDLAISLNKLLNKKEKSDFDSISYFVGDLMYKIVQYGSEMRKGLTNEITLYKGMQLNIIDLFEFIKNEKLFIAFPYFMMLTSKKELAEVNSKRNLNLIQRKDKNIFSVILNIKYLHGDEYKPSIFDLIDLLPYPDEEEFIVLPFTFFYIEKIKIDEKYMNVDIDMNVIGKSEILEEKIKLGQRIMYEKERHRMIPFCINDKNKIKKKKKK